MKAATNYRTGSRYNYESTSSVAALLVVTVFTLIASIVC